ncbi:hypothetical protein EVAR_102207_1 [Eumeta japonica]|uniref:Mariner Mos1 transposase n=1 Tax=Eumeta variegata TaxID=151549 RepID=A0A4C1WGI8_EUMVA|nr:hypothetical protein EVAR_102207_1 [Eumeta japonica]
MNSPPNINGPELCWSKKMLLKYDHGSSNSVYDIVTEDEIWIYCYMLERMRQSSVWVFEATANQQNSGRRVAFLEKVREKLPRNQVLLHHDNASSHTVNKTMSFLTTEILVTHPAFSADLLPCDIFIFPKIKDLMRSLTFTEPEEAVIAFNQHVQNMLSFERMKKLNLPITSSDKESTTLYASPSTRASRAGIQNGSRERAIYYSSRAVCNPVTAQHIKLTAGPSSLFIKAPFASARAPPPAIYLPNYPLYGFRKCSVNREERIVADCTRPCLTLPHRARSRDRYGSVLRARSGLVCRWARDLNFPYI